LAEWAATTVLGWCVALICHLRSGALSNPHRAERRVRKMMSEQSKNQGGAEKK
jgi:hypothetical protein